jgi:general secretion pathway protein D
MVLNNQTAKLEVGNQVPIATQSSVSTLTDNAPVVNSIEYKDTGVILRVTLRVNEGGLVLMDISQEVSDVAATTSSTLNSPQKRN